MSGDHNKYHMRVEFPERYEEQHMKTIELVDEQVDAIVVELKSMYDGLHKIYKAAFWTAQAMCTWTMTRTKTLPFCVT
jgi:hypothetical protein